MICNYNFFGKYNIVPSAIFAFYLGEFGLVYKGIWTHQNVENEEIVSDVVALKSIKSMRD